MSRYALTGIGALPSHCERIAKYWATLVCFDVGASGKAMGQRYRAAKAFKNGLRAYGLPESQVNQAYYDTLEMARLITATKPS